MGTAIKHCCCLFRRQKQRLLQEVFCFIINIEPVVAAYMVLAAATIECSTYAGCVIVIV
jgi:hypothetical protein